MSIGSPRKTMRFTEDEIQAIEAAITSANAQRVGEPYDWTAWVRKAVHEKLAHLKRGRRGRGVRGGLVAGGGSERDSGDRLWGVDPVFAGCDG